MTEQPSTELLLRMMAAWADTFGSPLTRYEAIHKVVVADLARNEQPVEPIGFAVRMAEGPFVGIWQDRATAEVVRAKQPETHDDQVIGVYTEDQLGMALLRLRAQLHHSLDNTDEAIEHLDNFAREVLAWCKHAAHPASQEDKLAWQQRADLVQRLLDAGNDRTQPQERSPA